MSDDLDPIDPETAVQMYLDSRRRELADATIQAHQYRLKQFVRWCDDDGLKNLNDLSGRDLHRFRIKRREDDFTRKKAYDGHIGLQVFRRNAEDL